MGIEYRKGDLFTAPSGSILGHACNCQGSWRSGVAKAFAEQYPISHKEYIQYCEERQKAREMVGDCFITSEGIACLFTSHRYGRYVDSPEMILEATEKALTSLIQQVEEGVEVHLPKINSGLFHVPWEQTEKCIEQILLRESKEVKVIVWEYDQQ